MIIINRRYAPTPAGLTPGIPGPGNLQWRSPEGCPGAGAYLEGLRRVDEVGAEPERREGAVNGKAVIKAELAAGHSRVYVAEALAADRPPRALEEDLHGAGGKAVDVDAADQPQVALVCTRTNASFGTRVGVLMS